MKAIVIPPRAALDNPSDAEDSLAYWLAQQGVEEVAWAPGARSGSEAWSGFLASAPAEAASDPSRSASVIAAQRAALGDSAVLVVGLDVPCSFDLEPMFKDHDAGPAIATIAVLPVLDEAVGGNVEMDRTDRVLRLSATRRGPQMPWVNARVYVVEPRLFESVPEGADWGIESGLFKLVLQSHGILMGHKIRQARPLVPGPCDAAHA